MQDSVLIVITCSHSFTFVYKPGKPYPVRRLLSTSISFISSTYCTSGNDKLLKSSLMFNNLMQQKDFILYEMQQCRTLTTRQQLANTFPFAYMVCGEQGNKSCFLHFKIVLPICAPYNRSISMPFAQPYHYRIYDFIKEKHRK